MLSHDSVIVINIRKKNENERKKSMKMVHPMVGWMGKETEFLGASLPLYSVVTVPAAV